MTQGEGVSCLRESIATIPPKTGEPDDCDASSSPAHDRGHDDPWQSIVVISSVPGSARDGTYQLHLIAQKLSWSHINQVPCALRFFYGVDLGHPAHWRNAHANNRRRFNH
jgi:hypothetical protein